MCHIVLHDLSMLYTHILDAIYIRTNARVDYTKFYIKLFLYHIIIQMEAEDLYTFAYPKAI